LVRQHLVDPQLPGHGLAAVENKVSVRDWHATILHLLGMRHRDLFIEQNGLKERLTGVAEARVIQEILS
jgi:hypothetical protein